jgi:flagellar basal-body rod modification protein FlgD
MNQPRLWLLEEIEMTALAAVNAQTSASAANAAALSKNQVDYQTFLKLLVTEMKNQDPTKPMESTEYVAQLANFSNVEQNVRTNAKLDQILQISVVSQAGSLVGKTLTTADESVTGKIEQIRIFEDGLVAVLEGGQEVVVGSGVTIS